MKRRVTFIVGTLNTGGIERCVTDWSIYLQHNTNWEPVVICLLKRSGAFLSVLESKGIEVKECKLRSPGFTFRLRNLLREINPEVVHSQVAFSMPWQVLAVLLSGSRHIIFTQHNEYQNWNNFRARIRIKLYFDFFFRFIDHYTCVSEKVRDSLCALVDRLPNEFIVVPNSVDTNLFSPDARQRSKQREHLQLEPDMFLVGMVARFSHQKGHRYLIEAVSILKESNVKLKILLVGVGELENEMRSLVEEYGLENEIQFYGQALNVHELFQAFDCFILPSLWEGMPLALLEAMASGIPVVGTDVAGTREIIRNKENGLLIQPKEPESIAHALKCLKSDLQLRTELAQRGLLVVRERHTIDANMKSYLDLYEK